MRFKHYLLLLFASFFISGCGLFSPYHKNSKGYYSVYNNSCGPNALQDALNVSRYKISKEIQDYESISKKILSVFHKDAVCITWPSEIEKICNKYGYELITIGELRQLDPEKDIAIVLVHQKFTFHYHWLCFPAEDVKTFGNETIIDGIYLLKAKKL